MQIFKKPEIVEWNFNGILIQEPMTSLTDILITVVCWILFWKLKPFHDRSKVYRLFRYFFLTMGLATLLGGIFGHAFNYAIGYELKLPGWIISMIAIMLAERSSIMHVKPLLKKRVGDLFSVLNLLELATLITATCITLNFFFVEFHALYGLLLVFGSFEFYNYRKTKDKGVKYLLLSVCVSAIAAFVHISYFTIHPWFNHLDLAHCIMCVSAYLLYMGVKTMKIKYEL